MSRALQKYLDHVMIYANRKPDEATKIRLELEDHLRQKITELEAQGLPNEDAVARAIKDHGSVRTVGYGLRKGFALLDVRTEGTARGVVAVGPRAVGVLAFGNVAMGLFAFGHISLGLIAFGAVALAGSVAVGGVSLAPLGAALGLAAVGRVACGIIAAGGLAVGLSIPWAIDRVSFLSGDNGLQFLQHFRTLVRDGTGNFVVILLVMWFFMVFPFLNGIMCSIQRNEYRRIKKADPDIDVSVTWP
ncbi:MAG: hypothetical protein AMJ65_00880 [Phycisphaerae bacterium SG8_4]|nr:MAG: hypothetical protein AMJ65_00880 [Phycisphaerae bacterium SG8_4]